jgi:small subunit ribosomal protein S8e
MGATRGTKMAIWQGRSKRKDTGGMYKPNRLKKAFEISPERQLAVVGESSVKHYRTRGANSKLRVMKADTANVLDPKTKKAAKSKIVTVKSNPADPNYVQRNILNKGAVIQTEAGLAKVTSRPGQDGIVNATLIE